MNTPSLRSIALSALVAGAMVLGACSGADPQTGDEQHQTELPPVGSDPYYDAMGPDDVLCVQGTVRDGDWGGNANYVLSEPRCYNRHGDELECGCLSYQVFGVNSLGLFGEGDEPEEHLPYSRIENGHYIDAILSEAVGHTAVLCPHPHMTPVMNGAGGYCEINLATNDQGIEVVQYGFAWDWEGETLVILDEGEPIWIPAGEIALP